MIADPDVFATLGLIGFTVAAPFYSERQAAASPRSTSRWPGSANISPSARSARAR